MGWDKRKTEKQKIHMHVTFLIEWRSLLIQNAKSQTKFVPQPQDSNQNTKKRSTVIIKRKDRRYTNNDFSKWYEFQLNLSPSASHILTPFICDSHPELTLMSFQILFKIMVLWSKCKSIIKKYKPKLFVKPLLLSMKTAVFFF